MAQQRLFVDIDGTLARFHDEIHYLERMFEEDFFRNLKPFENMVSGINEFIQEHPDVEVYTISACINSPYCIQEKNAWLDFQQLNIPENHRIFTVMGKAKSEYIPGGITRDDYLLDDYNRGLNQFLYDGGSAIKCHNNVNQQGLGAHGGSPGNLWVGPMVHVDDTPQMIAAELAQHMGLEYDLEKVVRSYEDIHILPEDKPDLRGLNSIQPTPDGCIARKYYVGGPGFVFSNPLNAIRFLAGNEDFFEYGAKNYEGQLVRGPEFQLRAISTNLYQSPDFQHFLRADHAQFAEDVTIARKNAKRGMVGQLQYKYPDGVGEVFTFYDYEAMQREVENGQASNRSMSISWFVSPSTKPIHELTNRAQLENRLQSEYKLDRDRAGEAATALLTPAQKRTPDQTKLLMEVWNNHSIPGPLNQFLRMPDPQNIRPAFDAVLSSAIQRAEAQTTPKESERGERGGKET